MWRQDEFVFRLCLCGDDFVLFLRLLGFMKTTNLSCPFCGGTLEPVKVIPEVKLGLLSSLFGYSTGTRARLSWSRPGENYAPTGIPEKSEYDGCRCASCGRITFTP